MDHTSRYKGSIRGDHRPGRVLKPVIKELVRTEVHPPLLELLVDKILIVSNVKAKGRNTEAFRIWLSDGEKSIQAGLTCYGDGGDVGSFKQSIAQDDYRLIQATEQEGSYVHVTKYELARGKKHSGDGFICYLRIADLIAVGADDRQPRKLSLGNIDEFRVEYDNRTSSPQHNTSESADEDISPPPSPSPNKKSTPFGTGIPDDEAVDLLQWYDKPPVTKLSSASDTEPNSNQNQDRSKKRKREEAQSTLQPLSPNIFSSPPKAPRLTRSQAPPANRLSAEDRHTTQTQMPPHPPPSSATPLLPISRPLRLTSLAALTGPHATRNKVVDVIAVVASVTPTLVKCPGIRPGIHYKRELRITDPSTSKKVMLSVFVKPEEFMPEVGTVALFRSVTTNKWDGGSLNTFKRDCEGREWFLESTEGLDGCDITELRDWWEKRQANDAER
ncbi:hypothetical protein MMC30_000346 [Trapelia coarctata]|nr:hypothetical protein [Trapelia coarctata]